MGICEKTNSKWFKKDKWLDFIQRSSLITWEIRELAINKSYSEIRKNARVLAQASRIGSILPDEILVKIAGHTRTTFFHSPEDAEKVAIKYFEKPRMGR